MRPCCVYAYQARANAEAKARLLRETYGQDTTDKEPEYAVGERVRVSGWIGHDFGVVAEIKRTFHNRLFEWVWGYRVNYENDGPGLSLVFVPEGYLRKVQSPAHTEDQ